MDERGTPFLHYVTLGLSAGGLGGYVDGRLSEVPLPIVDGIGSLSAGGWGGSGAW